MAGNMNLGQGFACVRVIFYIHASVAKERSAAVQLMQKEDYDDVFFIAIPHICTRNSLFELLLSGACACMNPCENLDLSGPWPGVRNKLDRFPLFLARHVDRISFCWIVQ